MEEVASTIQETYVFPEIGDAIAGRLQELLVFVVSIFGNEDGEKLSGGQGFLAT